MMIKKKVTLTFTSVTVRCPEPFECFNRAVCVGVDERRREYLGSVECEIGKAAALVIISGESGK